MAGEFSRSLVPYYVSPPAEFSHMKFFVRSMPHLMFTVPVVAAPANDASNASALLWFDANGVTAGAAAVLTEMRNAEKYGLRARDYTVDSLLVAPKRSPKIPTRGAAILDKDFSTSIGRFVTHLHSGRISPRALGHDLDVPHNTVDVAVAVRALAHSRAAAGRTRGLRTRVPPLRAAARSALALSRARRRTAARAAAILRPAERQARRAYAACPRCARGSCSSGISRNPR